MIELNLARLVLLISRQWAENRRLYLLGWGLLTGLLGIFYLFASEWSQGMLPRGADRELMFGLGLWVGGGLLANAQFAELSDRSRAIGWLMLPASALEKLLSAFFFTALVFPAVYLITFYGVETLFLGLLGEPRPNPPNRHVEGYLSLLYSEAGNFCLVFPGLLAIAILGSIHYERFSFVKTLASLIVVVFATVMLNTLIANILTPEGFAVTNAPPFVRTVLLYDHTYTDVYAPPTFRRVSNLLMFGLTPVLLWLTAYFRLREKQC
jgi:hypothetical protein